MAIRIKDVDRAARSAWHRAADLGFLRPPSPENEEFWRPVFSSRGHRLKGAFDGERCVGTLRSFPMEITVPGGGAVEADAITGVTVLPTHRRQGLLTRMMTTELTEAVARDQALAILISVEWPIYGRFGFGPATFSAEFDVDCARGGLRAEVVDWIDRAAGTVEIVDAEEYAKAAPEVHARFRARQVGAVERPEWRWQMMTGQRPHPVHKREGAFYVLHRDSSGRPTGALTYRIEDKENWIGGVPQVRLKVDDLIVGAERARDDAVAAAALWQYVTSVDWIGTVSTGGRSPDDPFPLLLEDARAARRVGGEDMLWLRVLDVPAALEARTYQAEGEVIIRVEDPQGHCNGSYHLEGGLDGATCTRTTQEPDITLPVDSLGTLYLGGESARRLQAAGRLAEEWTGAAARIDTLFNEARLPWSPDGF
ncbi:hypothetical protein BIV57_09545 [Mangrovactinospora gilvigrisea]|uniref:N-acetyltransferase domain-containing protein n=1 Tax=Mangrovactinospora gilvigrisea TaxID=1428644 RepID=A0A1J7C8H5_9ACTN|nr:GNAT family N-acetyltransferase [Mangrovactinospora gilvigrisea]OIV37836.1 hypothetical protein BIV57_09545 [Mangrovactinospora gilvigrisea]